MLILARKRGQSIQIGQDITVTVRRIHRNQVWLDTTAPADVPILRDNARRAVRFPWPAGAVDPDADTVELHIAAPPAPDRERPTIDVYLAGPYSHPDATVRRRRYEALTAEAARLTRDGLVVFSPITHTHALCTLHGLPREFSYWQKAVRVLLLNSAALRVLRLPGWAFSQGLQQEIALAEENAIPIIYADVAFPQ